MAQPSSPDDRAQRDRQSLRMELLRFASSRRVTGAPIVDVIRDAVAMEAFVAQPVEPTLIVDCSLEATR